MTGCSHPVGRVCHQPAAALRGPGGQPPLVGSESSRQLADRRPAPPAPPEPAGPEPGRAVRPELRTLGCPGQVSTPRVAAVPLADVGPRGLQATATGASSCPLPGQPRTQSWFPGPAPRPCPAGGGTSPPRAPAMLGCPSSAREVQAAPAGRGPTTSGPVRSAAHGPHPSDHITGATRETLRPEPTHWTVSHHRTCPGPGY